MARIEHCRRYSSAPVARAAWVSRGVCGGCHCCVCGVSGRARQLAGRSSSARLSSSSCSPMHKDPLDNRRHTIIACGRVLHVVTHKRTNKIVPSCPNYNKNKCDVIDYRAATPIMVHHRDLPAALPSHSTCCNDNNNMSSCQVVATTL